MRSSLLCLKNLSNASCFQGLYSHHPDICIFISPTGKSAQSLILLHSLHRGFFFSLPVLSNIANILRITFCIFCLVAYCLIFLHSLLTSTRFGLLLLADLKFHFTTPRFEAHSINTYIEQSAGDSYFVSHHPTPFSSFFTTRQTNQYGRNIFRLPYSDLSKVEFKSTHFATETLREMPAVNPDIKAPPSKQVCNF